MFFRDFALSGLSSVVKVDLVLCSKWIKFCVPSGISSVHYDAKWNKFCGST